MSEVVNAISSERCEQSRKFGNVSSGLSDPAVDESRRLRSLSNGWEKRAFMITPAVLQMMQSCLQVMVHYAFSIRLMTARHGRPNCPDHAL